VNSAASLAGALPVGRHAFKVGVLTAYAIPAVLLWGLLGLGAGSLGLLLPGAHGIALAATAAYGCYYGATELAGRGGLSPPGRLWQVPQTMLIDAPPRRRVLVWGALLGPGFATRNPFAGFGLLPLAVAAMPGIGPAVALGAAIGLSHGAARASALLHDVRDVNPPPVVRASPVAAPGHVEIDSDAPPTHLEMVLKIIYWRRFDGAALLMVAATGTCACLRYFT
jgi:hypothetical protein